MQRIPAYFEQLKRIPQFHREIRKARKTLGLPVDGFNSQDELRVWAMNRTNKKRTINFMAVYSEIENNLLNLANELLVRRYPSIDLTVRDRIKACYSLRDYIDFNLNISFSRQDTNQYAGLDVYIINRLNVSLLKHIKEIYKNGIIIAVPSDIARNELIDFVKDWFPVMRLNMIGKPVRIRSRKHDKIKVITEVWGEYSKYSISELRDSLGKYYRYKYAALAAIASGRLGKSISPEAFQKAISRLKISKELDI